MKPKPPVDQLAFGKIFTGQVWAKFLAKLERLAHILFCQTTCWQSTGRRKGGGKLPRLNLLPTSASIQEQRYSFALQVLCYRLFPQVLHYAQELFEGMKAYRGVDGKIRLFRPMHNMARMNLTASRACLPAFDGQELVECIRRLVVVDQEWVPHDTSSSLYIRPTMIGTEPTLGVAPAGEARLFVLLCPVGPYYSTGFKPVNLLADPQYVRAWPGGCGFTKMGSNYAPTLWTQVPTVHFGF